MAIVRADVELTGSRGSYRTEALVDTVARMTVIDSSLAGEIGIEYTGRELEFISISGHRVKALKGVVRELVIEGERLRYEAIAVTSFPHEVRKILKSSDLDERIIIGLLTLERANMIPDISAGKLKKVESFILLAGISPEYRLGEG